MVKPSVEVGPNGRPRKIQASHQKLRTKINTSQEKMEAGYEELRAPINACQKVTRATVRVLYGKTEAQTKFEGTVNKRVKDLDAEIRGTRPDMQHLRTSADERKQSVREELDMRIRGIGIDMKVTKKPMETPRREFRSRLRSKFK
jgi:hypothetical protein